MHRQSRETRAQSVAEYPPEQAMLALAAKTDPQNEERWLPLTVHLQDTAAVMEYLLTNWLPEQFHLHLGLQREALFELAIAAALLHDIGKSTRAFQWSITERRPELRKRLQAYGLTVEFPMGKPPERIPHAAAGAELLRLEHYGDDFAVVVGAHHGTPENQTDVRFCESSPLSFGWEKNGDRATSWGAVQRALLRWAQAETTPPERLPECSMTAQMVLTSLVIMADWIASNTAYFPLLPAEELPRAYDRSRTANAVRTLHLPKPWRISADWQTADSFERRFGFAANPVQMGAEQIAAEMKTPGVLILEAPMGQGKTEAALAAAEILMNRFHLGGAAFFLPSQATSNAMFTRMARWARRQPDAVRVAVELIHGQAEQNAEFSQLAAGRVQIAQGEAEADPLTVHSFFCGRKTKLLANLVVGTIDQLLMAALKQRHVMLRHLGLVGKVVIIDECHAYDAYMNTYLDCVLDWLGAYRVPVILLSATLPGGRRAELLRAYLGQRRAAMPEIEASQAYPMLCWTAENAAHMTCIASDGRSRSVAIQKVGEDAAIDEIGAALRQGCVGVIVNTVKRAQTLQKLLQKRYPDAEILMDHSRFLAPHRLAHETKILERVGKNSDAELRRGVLVIGTQVLEQSLDLDFDLLITDLCPMDLLLQRIGRLHRHIRQRPSGLKTPRCLVMGAQEKLEDGSRAVYGDYLLLRTRALLPETIRLPQDISPLVQKAYDETLWSPEPEPGYEKARNDAQLAQKNQQKNARSYRIDPPARDGFFDTIEGLLDRAPGLTEPQARAAVRDGSAAIEVLVVQQTEDGMVTLLSGSGKGAQYRADSQPSAEEARAIAAQRLRLPAFFSKRYHADAVIEELAANAGRLPLWNQAPLLAGELFLILNSDGTAELAGKQLRYDPCIGLMEKEKQNGTNCV